MNQTPAKIKGLALLSGCLAAACCGTISAEDSAVELNTIEVSVLRAEQPANEANRSIVVKTREDLEQIQPQSTAEALSYEPNIEIAGGPRGNNQEVNIRGLEGERVLQTVDGVRQNFESGHRPTYSLDPILIKQIEVVKGPSSSLWGSGALGGVVAQQTIDAGDILDPDANVGALVKYAYNDNTSGDAVTVAGGVRAGVMDLLLSGYMRDEDNFEMGNGEELANSAYKDDGALVKAGFQINDANNLEVSYRQSTNEGRVPSNGSATAGGTSNPIIDRERDNSQFSVDYRFNPTNNELVNLQALVYENETEVDESRVSDGRNDKTELDTFGFNINNQSAVGMANLIYGIDYYKDDFNAERDSSSGPRPTPPEGETEVSGAFITADLKFNEVLSGDIGYRYDEFETEANNLNTSRDDSAGSLSAGLAWQATSWLNLGLRYDEAFRAPSSEELYTTGTHFCVFGTCQVFLPNPTLDPEEAANKEFIFDMNWTGLASEDDSLRIHGAYFENDVDNFISQTTFDPFTITLPFFPFTPIATVDTKAINVNVEEAELKGFELEGIYQIGELNLSLAYGQTRGEDKQTGDNLYDIPADKWIADISYNFIPTELTAGLRYLTADDQDKVPANSTTTSYEGYDIYDLYASYKPAALDHKLALDLVIKNVGDEYYRRAFQELYEPGQEIILSASYRF